MSEDYGSWTFYASLFANQDREAERLAERAERARKHSLEHGGAIGRERMQASRRRGQAQMQQRQK